MRNLDHHAETFKGAVEFYAGLFLMNRGVMDRDWVMGQFYDFTFDDEFEAMKELMRGQLGSAALDDFEQRASGIFTPRSEVVFHGLLADKLAIDPDGEHIPGKIGTTIVAGRIVGHRIKHVVSRLTGRSWDLPKNVYWNVYAGEGEERVADSGVADALPDGTQGLSLGALAPGISNEIALLMLDAGVDNLDEGTLGAVIQGRDGAQPAFVDDVVVGTNLFTLTMTTPNAFGNAADATPGGIATAATITDDTSADATSTLTYCRISSSSVADTPLDDHFDGEAGTAGADFNFNTLSIVAGATVSMTGLTISLPEA